jgi:hypothetical protein
LTPQISPHNPLRRRTPRQSPQSAVVGPVHECPQLASHASHHDPFIHVPVTRKDKEKEEENEGNKEEY